MAQTPENKAVHILQEELGEVDGLLFATSPPQNMKEQDSTEDVNDKKSQSRAEESAVPIDRGWAWVIVAACFGMHVLIVGGAKSFGVLFVEFQDKYGATASELALINGIATTLMMALGLVANLLAIRFTCRKVVFLGGLLTALGLLSTAYIPQFSFMYCTYSVVTGLGYALSYSPCVVMVGQYFQKRRSLANGISVSGSGVGSFILPILMRQILKTYSLNDCLLILSAIMLNVCACALLFRPISSYSRKNLIKTELDPVLPAAVMQEDSQILQDLGEHGKCPHLSQFPPLDNQSAARVLTDPERLSLKDGCERKTSQVSLSLQQPRDWDFALVTGSLQDMPRTASILSEEHHKSSPSKRQKLFNWSLLRNPVFMLYAGACCSANFAYPNIFLMLPAHAELNGQSRDNSALLVSVIGITDLLGRLFFGWFSDFKFIPKRWGFIGCIAVSGVLSLLVPLLTSFVALATYAALYGFFAGSYISLVAVMLAEALGVEKLSSSYGLAVLAMSLSLLPGPLICGGIRDATNSWNFAFIFCGVMALIGSLPPVFEPCAQRYLRRQELRKSQHV